MQGLRLREKLLGAQLHLVRSDGDGAKAAWDGFEAAVVPYLSEIRRKRDEAQSAEAKRIASAFVALGPLTIIQGA